MKENSMVNKEGFTSIENRWAVLIGINNYGDATIRPLNCSVSDIKLFHSVLVDEKRGKFDPAKVRLLVQDDEEGSINPIRSNILSALHHLSRVATKNDGILIYFSGHGFEDKGRSYLLPSDASIDVLSETAISVDWINSIVEESDARVKVLIFDCCRAGARLDKASIGPMKEEFYNAIFKEAEGKAVLSSSKVNESSYEWHEKEHSVFTYFIVEGMRGKADYDKDGMISITDINKYVSGNVREWAFKNGVQQTPTLQYWVSGDILLSYVPIGDREPEEVIPEKRNEVFKNINSIVLKINEDIHDQLCALLLEWFNANEITSENYPTIEFPYGSIDIDYSRLVTTITFRFEGGKNEDLLMIFDIISKKRNWNRIKYTFTNRMNFQKLINIFKENHIDIISFKPPHIQYDRFKETIMGEAKAWGSGVYSAFIEVKNYESFSELEIKYELDKDFEKNFFEKFNPKTLSFLFKAFESAKKPEKKAKEDEYEGEKRSG